MVMAPFDIYISQLLTFKKQLHLQSDFFEDLSVDVRINNDIFSINHYYRPPNQENHSANEQLITNNLIIRLMLRFQNWNEHQLRNLMCTLCKQPTRVSKYTKTN